MVEAAPVAEVPSPPQLTPARFADFVRPGRPLLLRGLAAHWPARRWDFPQVRDRFPSRPLRATGVAAADSLEVRTWHVSREQIVSRIRGVAGEGERADEGSARPDWLFDVPGDLPELLPELPPPNVALGPVQYRLFLGRQTYTPGHYHSYQHALICQIHGNKRVLLYPPDDTRLLDPYPLAAESSHYRSSRIDFAAPDLQRHPGLSRAHPLQALLTPGDALFIPVHWWHAVYGSGPVMSTSLFWNARLRDYRFPQPGLQALAGLLRWHAWPKLRGLARGAAASHGVA